MASTWTETEKQNTGRFTYHSSTGKQEGKALINFRQQATGNMLTMLIARPGTAHVEMSGVSRKVADHGTLYVGKGLGKLDLSDIITKTKSPGSWTKTATIEYTYIFKTKEI